MQQKLEFESQITTDPTLNRLYVIKRKISTVGKIWTFQVENNILKKEGTLKVEAKNSENKQQFVLDKQYSVFKSLEDIKGIPQVRDIGFWSYGKYMELQHFTKDLSSCVDLTVVVGKKQLKYLTSKLIRIMKQIHEQGMILGSLSLESLMISSNRKIYLTGCPHARQLKQNYLIVPTAPQKISPIYQSIRVNNGQQNNFRDDLEMIFYILIHIFHKNLPWKRRQCSKQIAKLKLFHYQSLLKRMGKEFINGFRYIRNIDQNKDINYQFLSKLFIDIEPPKEIQITKSQRKSKRLSIALSIKASQQTQTGNLGICSNQEVIEYINNTTNLVQQTPPSTIVINRILKNSSFLVPADENSGSGQFIVQDVNFSGELNLNNQTSSDSDSNPDETITTEEMECDIQPIIPKIPQTFPIHNPLCF